MCNTHFIELYDKSEYYSKAKRVNRDRQKIRGLSQITQDIEHGCRLLPNVHFLYL